MAISRFLDGRKKVLKMCRISGLRLSEFTIDIEYATERKMVTQKFKYCRQIYILDRISSTYIHKRNTSIGVI